MKAIKHTLNISKRQCLVDITGYIKDDVRKSGIREGIAVIYSLHTTAGITINENADPDVCTDMIYGYEKVFPTDDPVYRHFEGNSHAHMKTSAMGPSQILIIEEGRLILGTWQDVYFCEFDGPRNRSFYVKLIEG